MDVHVSSDSAHGEKACVNASHSYALVGPYAPSRRVQTCTQRLAMPRRATLPTRTPRSRVMQQTDAYLQGQPSREYVDPDVAYRRLEQTQTKPCIGKRVLAFARLSSFGVANDLNNAVKALHIANARLAQLVFLPPARTELLKLNLSLPSDAPWHWLPDQPLSDVLSLSACHRHLLQHNRSWLELVAAEGLSPELQAALPFSARMLSLNWRQGAYLRQIPLEFRGQGMLWWWSILSTYLVRPTGQLVRRLQHHPALTMSSLPSRSPAIFDFRSIETVFDVGLHLRMGDACGTNAIPQASRRCVKTLREALARVALPPNSSVFLATDSEAVMQSVADVARDHPGLRIYHLDGIDRAKYDSQTRIEQRRHIDRAEILTEALLDIAFLSLSRRVVGAMIGNLPRLALQLRVRRSFDYMALDNRAWCTRTACKLDGYKMTEGV